MKVLLMFLLCSFQAFSQDIVEPDGYEPDPQIYREEGSPYSEINPAYSDEVPAPELGRQEEEYYGDAPVDPDWSLDNEEIPSEELED